MYNPSYESIIKGKVKYNSKEGAAIIIETNLIENISVNTIVNQNFGNFNYGFEIIYKDL
jgi:hypothetical protein